MSKFDKHASLSGEGEKDVRRGRRLLAEDAQQEVSFVVGFERGRYDHVVARRQFVSAHHLAGVAERRPAERLVKLEEVLVQRTACLRRCLFPITQYTLVYHCSAPDLFHKLCRDGYSRHQLLLPFRKRNNLRDRSPVI